MDYAPRLSGRVRAFVDAYVGVAGGNATKAAQIAGYTHPHARAHEVLKRPQVQKVISTLTAEKAMARDEVLKRLSDIARANVADFMGLVGLRAQVEIAAELKRLDDLGISCLISKLTPTRNGLAVELYDAQAALVTLAKYHGLLVDRVKISPDIDWDSLSTEQMEQIAEGKPI